MSPDIYRSHALFLVLVRVHQVFSVIVLSICQLKGGKEALELMNKVIINLASLEFDNVRSLTIVRAHQRVAEDRHVEELLDHGVLVAGST